MSSTLAYPARFIKEKGGSYSVSFPDLPGAHTMGETKEEAFRMAIDCLHTALDWRLERKDPIPAPSEVKRGQVVIPVPLEIAPKIALLQAMRERKVSNTTLARELNITETVVRRMLDPKHKSKPDQYTRALLAMGCAVEVSIVPVAR
jgi:antitoxin HicB